MEARDIFEERYTVQEFLSLGEDVRSELIDGDIYMMSPVRRIHQDAVGSLFNQIYSYLNGKQCKVYLAPYSVRLFKEKETLLEPDIFVVCDKTKLADNVCDGPPDMVAEVLSPSNQKHDKVVKYALYQQAGVREYWIVDPEAKLIDVYLLENGRYFHNVYSDEDSLPVTVLEGCSVDLGKVFPKENE